MYYYNISYLGCLCKCVSPGDHLVLVQQWVTDAAASGLMMERQTKRTSVKWTAHPCSFIHSTRKQAATKHSYFQNQ